MVYRRSSAAGLPVVARKREAPLAAEASAAVGPMSLEKRPSMRSNRSARLVDERDSQDVVALFGDRAGDLSCVSVYRASPLERIDMIRRGIAASEAKRIFAAVPVGQGAGFKALNLSIATVNKKAKAGEMLSPEESERVVGFARLVGQLEAMIEDAGEPAGFDAKAWMARWLSEPLPALGGARPADLIDTMEGQALVSAALARVESGAYA